VRRGPGDRDSIDRVRLAVLPRRVARACGQFGATARPARPINLLKRRNGMARIYLFGGPDQISGAVAKQLAQYGTVIRVTNNAERSYGRWPRPGA